MKRVAVMFMKIYELLKYLQPYLLYASFRDASSVLTAAFSRQEISYGNVGEVSWATDVT